MSALLVLAAVGLAAQAVHCPAGCSCRDAPSDLTSTHLDLAGCALDSLANASLGLYPNLQALDLSHNNLSHLPDDALAYNLTSLRVLDLSNNLLHAVYGSPFRTLRVLRVLNLSGNAIDIISVDGFRGVGTLQSLDLSGNNLTVFPDHVFVPLVNLQHLNLSGNRLQTLTDGCFGSLLRLQQLDLSWNQLNHVAPSTLQALPSLSRLLLADNPDLGGSVKEAALLVGTGRRLQTVDASRTGLKHVPATLTHSVRTLRLAGNSIRIVRCGDLDSYPLLQLLDLTTNSLNEIEEDALGRLEMLAVLYLTNNKLSAIPRSLPDHLEILHLEFNEIEQIVSGDLLGLPKLEVLLLNDNAIKVVQEGAFSQVTSLVTLDLSRNPISILPADTLAGPARLQMLRLSDLTVNPPAEDMAFPVPAPEHLVRLDLSRSPGLAHQLLADTAALAAFRELQELNLANTGLTNIRSDLLYYLPQMHDFHLTGNNLNCSGLLWLALWMRRQDQPEYRKVICESPPELYGTLVVDLQNTDVQDVATTIMSTTVMVTTMTTVTSTERMKNEIVVTSEAPTTSVFNNMTAKEADRSAVTGLQNTVSSVWAVEVEVTETPEEAVASERVTEAEDRSGVSTDQLHLFPIALGRGTTPEPPTDKTDVPPPVTDGHIDEIYPSDNRGATEPSNYTTNALPPETSTLSADSFFRDRAAGNGNGNGSAELQEHPQARKQHPQEDSLAGVRPSPALFALLAAALGAGAALCSLVSHVRRRRRRGAHASFDRGYGYDRHQDIEVNSLASMHELW